jgi:drug/metabolite transporter (DMT)-like permease
MDARSAALVTGFCAILWGLSFPVNDAGLKVLDPAVFAFWRFVIATVAAAIVAASLGKLQTRVFGEPIVWGMGALNAAGFLFQYLGQTQTTPARAALFVNANVITVAVLSWIVLREKPRVRVVVPLILALAGVVLLQLPEGVGSLAAGTHTGVGDALTFLCGAAGAGFFVLYKPSLRRANVASLSVATFAITALLLGPFALVGDFSQTVSPNPAGWAPILYAGLVASALAYWLWGLALEEISPTASAIILLLEVVVAALVSVALGLEGFTEVGALGALLLLGGVTAMSLAQKA